MSLLSAILLGILGSFIFAFVGFLIFLIIVLMA